MKFCFKLSVKFKSPFSELKLFLTYIGLILREREITSYLKREFITNGTPHDSATGIEEGTGSGHSGEEAIVRDM